MAIQKYAGVTVILLFFGIVRSWAANDGLAKLQTVPAGERAANYLQSYLTTIGTVVEAKNAGGILGGTQTYRVVVIYNPDEQGLEVTLIGSVQDPEIIQNMMGTLEKIILGSSSKLKKYFDVTLGDADLSMDYLYAKTGRVLARYRDGKYSTGSVTDKSPAVRPTPQATPGT